MKTTGKLVTLAAAKLPSTYALKAMDISDIAVPFGRSASCTNTIGIFYDGEQGSLPVVKSKTVEIENLELINLLGKNRLLTSRGLTEYIDHVQGHQEETKWASLSPDERIRKLFNGWIQFMGEQLTGMGKKGDAEEKDEVLRREKKNEMCKAGMRMGEEITFVFALYQAWLNPNSKADIEALFAACEEFIELLPPALSELSPGPAQSA